MGGMDSQARRAGFPEKVGTSTRRRRRMSNGQEAKENFS